MEDISIENIFTMQKEVNDKITKLYTDKYVEAYIKTIEYKTKQFKEKIQTNSDKIDNMFQKFHRNVKCHETSFVIDDVIKIIEDKIEERLEERFKIVKSNFDENLKDIKKDFDEKLEGIEKKFDEKIKVIGEKLETINKGINLAHANNNSSEEGIKCNKVEINKSIDHVNNYVKSNDERNNENEEAIINLCSEYKRIVENIASNNNTSDESFNSIENKNKKLENELKTHIANNTKYFVEFNKSISQIDKSINGINESIEEITKAIEILNHNSVCHEDTLKDILKNNVHGPPKEQYGPPYQEQRPPQERHNSYQEQRPPQERHNSYQEQRPPQEQYGPPRTFFANDKNFTNNFQKNDNFDRQNKKGYSRGNSRGRRNDY